MTNSIFIRAFPLLALMATLTACEETVDITDAAYVERLVVYGVLQEGYPVDISITKTLPINEPYSAQRAALSDATASLTVEDPASGAVVETVQLRNYSDGHYREPAMTVVSGRRYRFHATWHGKTVSAVTTVPLAARVDTLDLKIVIRDYGEWADTSRYLRAVVRPRAGEVYLLTTADVDQRTGKTVINNTYGDAQIGRMRDIRPGGDIELLERGYRPNTPTIGVVIAYDEPYYEFQQTYYTNNDNGPFGTGSDNVRWTIEGDGIGLFIGRSMVERHR